MPCIAPTAPRLSVPRLAAMSPLDCRHHRGALCKAALPSADETHSPDRAIGVSSSPPCPLRHHSLPPLVLRRPALPAPDSTARSCPAPPPASPPSPPAAAMAWRVTTTDSAVPWGPAVPSHATMHAPSAGLPGCAECGSPQGCGREASCAACGAWRQRLLALLASATARVPGDGEGKEQGPAVAAHGRHDEVRVQLGEEQQRQSLAPPQAAALAPLPCDRPCVSGGACGALGGDSTSCAAAGVRGGAMQGHTDGGVGDNERDGRGRAMGMAGVRTGGEVHGTHGALQQEQRARVQGKEGAVSAGHDGASRKAAPCGSAPPQRERAGAAADEPRSGRGHEWAAPSMSVAQAPPRVLAQRSTDARPAAEAAGEESPPCLVLPVGVSPELLLASPILPPTHRTFCLATSLASCHAATRAPSFQQHTHGQHLRAAAACPCARTSAPCTHHHAARLTSPVRVHDSRGEEVETSRKWGGGGGAFGAQGAGVEEGRVQAMQEAACGDGRAGTESAVGVPTHAQAAMEARCKEGATVAGGRGLKRARREERRAKGEGKAGDGRTSKACSKRHCAPLELASRPCSIAAADGGQQQEAVGERQAEHEGSEGQGGGKGEKLVVRVTCEEEAVEDGYRWRKYGQKVVRGNTYPRSYFKCSHAGCVVRKHVERSSRPPFDVVITYEGRHNHNLPAAKPGHVYMCFEGDGVFTVSAVPAIGASASRAENSE
ncbi:unnamed protein product [Closterium sp. Naga37s-1]|nr:unnamed protein product [Closterium sp. Naga37s-1]